VLYEVVKIILGISAPLLYAAATDINIPQLATPNVAVQRLG